MCEIYDVLLPFMQYGILVVEGLVGVHEEEIHATLGKTTLICFK